MFFVTNESNKKIDWKPAFDVFSRVSTWVVVPIVLALIIGKALDSHYGTDPWIFLGCTGLGFIISSYGIVRVVFKYMKTLEIEDKKDKK
ncbi:hypothetical protein A2456_02925 [Candidatus Nomurabacteria bacterium RIFOXYC2_FULL_36_19]|uniref:AtpZ/AtpI family protein n=2 Tax=Candidatus Nomuraibacteriota TaxID=1752729 RepID=A0A1F6YWH7_9BACT|nr:MAG: hypothetical protein A2238_01070 [Candidatus Nomurabacteria bacterium RIFOXYA2_FULL_35_9]OGJ06611.1 MAG: hypothetical protein A2192_00735 [Candidatus Nomurabacteria bacterium RIFOXYA1_FULL_35_17]OGJ10761.1 MAG: hypothetical protein A2456_02925 [Candidatus Nomurabacteria bacterium RIFOXYC2_FULL_36_19]OGJ13954.1 MAG: hypothetical protein A2554_02970 [Candidatus Nomurabacteria bacterium RIFOXYD2_FULL_35_12]